MIGWKKKKKKIKDGQETDGSYGMSHLEVLPAVVMLGLQAQTLNVGLCVFPSHPLLFLSAS